MTNYPTLRNALEIFSIQLGLDDESAQKMLLRSLQKSEWKRSIKEELHNLFQDPNAPWKDLISNELYEIDEPESENEARQIIINLIWNSVFSVPVSDEGDLEVNR